LVELVKYVPGQQVFDAVDRMIGNPLQNVMQIPLRINVIEFATFDKGIDDRRALTTGVGSEE